MFSIIGNQTTTSNKSVQTESKKKQWTNLDLAEKLWFGSGAPTGITWTGGITYWGASGSLLFIDCRAFCLLNCSFLETNLSWTTVMTRKESNPRQTNPPPGSSFESRLVWYLGGPIAKQLEGLCGPLSNILPQTSRSWIKNYWILLYNLPKFNSSTDEEVDAVIWQIFWRRFSHDFCAVQFYEEERKRNKEEEIVIVFIHLPQQHHECNQDQ